MALVMICCQKAALLSTPASLWGKSIAAGAIANISYGTALWAMTKAPIGLVGAIRETSVLFAALIAMVILKERFGVARWVAAFMIVVGLGLAKSG